MQILIDDVEAITVRCITSLKHCFITLNKQFDWNSSVGVLYQKLMDTLQPIRIVRKSIRAIEKKKKKSEESEEIASIERKFQN